MKPLKRIGIAILVVLVGLQFIPTRSNQSSIVPSTDFTLTYKVPEDVGHILLTSCYNCHSNNTNNFIHHEARLSQESKKALVDYLNVLKDSLQ